MASPFRTIMRSSLRGTREFWVVALPSLNRYVKLQDKHRQWYVLELLAHLDPFLGFGDHQVAIQERIGMLAQRLDDWRPNSKVWHEMTILEQGCGDLRSMICWAGLVCVACTQVKTIPLHLCAANQLQAALSFGIRPKALQSQRREWMGI